MHIYQLTFADGKQCRSIVMEPAEDPAEDVEGVRSIFRPDYLISMDRIIAPPPAKLPWKRDGDCWRIGRFKLVRLAAGLFRVEWPGGSAEGGKDKVSSAVRENWEKGC